MTSNEAKAALVDFLKTNRIDQKEFAEMIGKSEVTISRWLNSDKPLSASNINAIQFILWSHATKSGIKTGEKHPGNCSFDVPEPVFVPLLTVAQAASVQPAPFGPPSNIEAGEKSGFISAREGDFAIVVSGRSMMPWYPPGTHLLVRRGELPKTGDRVVAMLEGNAEPIFKVFVDLGDKFGLLSINQSEGIDPIWLNKMDRESWYWVWPIIESKRDERALDAAMKEFGVRHFWEDRVAEAMKKQSRQ